MKMRVFRFIFITFLFAVSLVVGAPQDDGGGDGGDGGDDYSKMMMYV